MMSCVGVLAGGCVTTGKGTAPLEDCRGREPIPMTEAVIKAMRHQQLARSVAYNEQLEAECGIKAPNPSGRPAGAS